MKYSQAALVACVATGTISLSGVSAQPYVHPHSSAPSERDGEINVSPSMARTLTPHHTYPVRQYLDEMDARGLSDMVQAAKKTRKENKAKRIYAKADRDAAMAASAYGGGALGGRDLLSTDDLSIREHNVDDELAARLFDHFRANYRKAKAERLRKDADKAALKAGIKAGGAAAAPCAYPRIMAARALNDFEDDILARGFGSTEDELATRTFKQNLKHAKAAVRAGKATFRAGKATVKAGKAALNTGGGAGTGRGDVTRRDLHFEDAAVGARSFADVVVALKKQWNAGKAERLQTQANLAAGKAASAAYGLSTRSLWDFGSMEDLD